MFIPIGEGAAPRRSVPWAVLGLIAANVLAFALQSWRGESFTAALALVPKEIRTGVDIAGTVTIEAPEDAPETGVTIRHARSPLPVYASLLVSQFLHASPLHLFGNMLMLWIMGASLAERLGRTRFLAFYVACGVAAGLGHVAADPRSVVPCVGASGAVSGLVAAYAVTFPLRPLTVMAAGFAWYGPLRAPAAMVAGLWLAFQGLYTWNAKLRGPGTAGGIAFAAHIAGFVAGFLLSIFVVPNAPRKQDAEGRDTRERAITGGLPAAVEAHIQTIRNEALARGAPDEAERIDLARRDLVDWLRGRTAWPPDGEMIALFQSQVRKYQHLA